MPELAFHFRHLLGNVFFGQGDWRKRSPSIAKSLRLKPNYAQLHNGLGNALNRPGKA